MNPAKLIEKAKHSSFYRWVLNKALNRMIPFNAPHSFEVTAITDNSITTRLPYKTKNLNHVRGLHACALATLSEFTTGFLLISRLGMGSHRIILQKLQMDYHYQGKMDATAHFSMEEEWLMREIVEPLKTQDSVLVPCEVKIHDKQGNHLTTAIVYWQLKDWKKVKTKT
ncbi:MAG: YiiD C-terminal domain-containing protein [Bacteroidetes bacterium]|nr:YiiD C-terminal domain-containing protein [Bacteroidota bacterium]MBS1539878.1 YiiD C-terminal domain-containing protein [Bacteroidota bacterium]